MVVFGIAHPDIVDITFIPPVVKNFNISLIGSEMTKYFPNVFNVIQFRAVWCYKSNVKTSSRRSNQLDKVFP